MLQWIRARGRLVAATVLVALVGLGGVSSVSHAGDCHDQDCGMSVLPHDPASHSIRTGSAAESHPLHCVLCHWTRSTRPSTEAAHHLPRPVTDPVRLYAEVLGALSLVHAAQPPLRSPPVAPALNA
jgi:hypothetical protein